MSASVYVRKCRSCGLDVFGVGLIQRERPHEKPVQRVVQKEAALLEVLRACELEGPVLDHRHELGDRGCFAISLVVAIAYNLSVAPGATDRAR